MPIYTERLGDGDKDADIHTETRRRRQDADIHRETRRQRQGCRYTQRD